MSKKTGRSMSHEYISLWINIHWDDYEDGRKMANDAWDAWMRYKGEKGSRE